MIYKVLIVSRVMSSRVKVSPVIARTVRRHSLYTGCDIAADGCRFEPGRANLQEQAAGSEDQAQG
jgi:hypothetical protein